MFSDFENWNEFDGEMDSSQTPGALNPPNRLSAVTDLDALLAWLCIKGIYFDHLPIAVVQLGCDQNVSIAQLEAVVQRTVEECRRWQTRSLSKDRYVYVWVNAVYPGCPLSKSHPCFLVMVGVTDQGKEELVAIAAGSRSGKEQWYDLLKDVTKRGMQQPALVIGDADLGIWHSLHSFFPFTPVQLSWPQTFQAMTASMRDGDRTGIRHELKKICAARTRNATAELVASFISHHAKCLGTGHLLSRNVPRLLTFFAFPRQHWVYLRDTEPIHAIFEGVQLMPYEPRSQKVQEFRLAMAFKLAQQVLGKRSVLKNARLLSRMIHMTQGSTAA